EIEELRLKIEELKIAKENLRASYSEYDVQRIEKTQRINSVRSQLTSLHTELDQARSSLHSQQFKEQELSYKQQSIKARLTQAYRISIDELPVAAEGVQQEQPALNLEELIAQIETLRKRCEGYG